MRVLTYNLLAGEEDDAERLIQATALLRAAAPDLLVLNECKLLADRVRLAELEAALGMQAQLALAASGFHVALLVRVGTVEQVERISQGLTHAALVAHVRVGSQQLQVIAAHLDAYSPAKRLQEAELLTSHLSAERPNLLLGDLNAVSPRDAPAAQPEAWVERYRTRHLDPAGTIDTRAIELLTSRGLVDIHAALHNQTAPTRPTTRYARPDRPAQRLDYIFASPELASAARSCAPFEHAHAQTASDHLPLYADLDLALTATAE